MRLRKQQRLALVVLALVLVGGATGLVLAALDDKVAFFVTPTDLAQRQLAAGKRFRLGGLVVDGSIRREPDGTVWFAVTDKAKEVRVAYKGLLPDLFRDGQGVVTQGVLREDGVFQASEVLAKHDENYMPKEVADALKQSGYWNAQGKPEAAPP
ncbi:MAG: cytochrome c maturation protein CcmE [Geminicoccaceae bacterium]